MVRWLKPSSTIPLAQDIFLFLWLKQMYILDILRCHPELGLKQLRTTRIQFGMITNIFGCYEQLWFLN